ncbi:unnamed protein product [Polarella glacialis]|uniref:UBX domain-containing protein n=1 Tax=Polarella glacialis TaxID=89957 RepID=A0A813LYA9_POLGL|nr:unnamed protein product [Polarella glacialis]
MAEAREESPFAWHCSVLSHFPVGSGMARYTKYRAQSRVSGEAPQDLVFRFSEVDRLREKLSSMPELTDSPMPRLPPKATMRSIIHGKLDDMFLQERLALLQAFFQELCSRLNSKYAAIGSSLELCEPLGEFVRKAAELGLVAERAAFSAATAQIRLEEDREIVAGQNREYEESLRADELRRVAVVDKAEREQREAAEEASLLEAAAAQAAAAIEDIRTRRAAFEASHPVPSAGQPQGVIRFRAASGVTIQRAFSDATRVASLFEFAAVADWRGPAQGQTFDLRTSIPVRGLRGLEEQSLLEAGLCPSAALLVAEDEL